jgi:alkylhydroperoxidase family enzyme
MSNIQQSRKALASRILEGDGKASHAQRRQAYENTAVEGPLGTLVDKVTKHAHEVTDADIDAARTAGFSEDQILEIVICAAVGEATRQHDSALAALEAASKE